MKERCKMNRRKIWWSSIGEDLKEVSCLIEEENLRGFVYGGCCRRGAKEERKLINGMVKES